jgi:glycosyltransferase involved in cell wall biosynthesis
MKITIDVRMLHASGIGVYLRNLVPRLMRLRPADRFCLIGKAADREDTCWNGLPSFEWKDCEAPIYSLRQQWQLLGCIPKDTDLYWSPHFDIPALYRGKLLVTVHDVFHLAMPELVGGPHKRLYARWMYGNAVRKADAIIAISQFTKGELVRLAKAPEGKIHTIHNGVDESWFQVPKGENPHPKPYFLYAGNIKPHKNLRRLLEAFRLVQDKVLQDLVLTGQIEGFLTGDDEVKRLAESFGGRVALVGTMALPELQRYFANADALIFPSLYEGFGLPPLEAMACGCPVAASTAASIPEVCGEAALYFDPLDVQEMADKMVRLVQDQGLRKELMAKGSKRARDFSWDECAQRTNAVMDQVLTPRQGGS